MFWFLIKRIKNYSNFSIYGPIFFLLIVYKYLYSFFSLTIVLFYCYSCFIGVIYPLYYILLYFGKRNHSFPLTLKVSTPILFWPNLVFSLFRFGKMKEMIKQLAAFKYSSSNKLEIEVGKCSFHSCIPRNRFSVTAMCREMYCTNRTWIYRKT